jgi:ferredoxin--NADP+ reductase/benzoate/toluate 1,2-dioxygenase reductase subunit
MRITGNEQENSHMVLSNTHITDTTCVLKFERKNIAFITGQHLGVGPIDGIRTREYSIYSAEKDDYIEILVKEVVDGQVSPVLTHLQKGDFVVVDNPVGNFSLQKNLDTSQKHIFIASGTGIAPFHSFIKTFNSLQYKLIHGVRFANETYGMESYDPNRYTLCVSGEKNNGFQGRVTDFIKANPQGSNHFYYLCGNSNMIHEMYEILEKQKVSDDNIFAEVYF